MIHILLGITLVSSTYSRILCKTYTYYVIHILLPITVVHTVGYCDTYTAWYYFSK